jgi:hypothetical protein
MAFTVNANGAKHRVGVAGDTFLSMSQDLFDTTKTKFN